MCRLFLYLCCFILLGMSASPVWGQQGDKSADSYQHIKVSRTVGVLLVNAGISQAQARNLASQCGLTGYQPLPVATQKSLRCGQPVPPGISRQLVPMVMLQQLPARHGYEWRIAGKDLILVNWAGGMVAEILSNVFE